MGLSVAIAGAIILSVLLLVLMSMSGMVNNIFSISETGSTVFQLEKSISQTDIDLDTLLAVAGSPRVNFTLNSDEQEKLWRFEEFDVIVNYEGVTSGRLSEELTYNGDCGVGGATPVGSWCIDLITGVRDPNIINDGESAIIRTNVNENLANGQAAVTVSTDRGVVASLPSFKPTSFDISSDPPVPCQIGFYGRTFQDTDTGISYICDPSRDKWLSLETMVEMGEESSTCDSGDTIADDQDCGVTWGNNLGSDVTLMGYYIPYNMTITAYGFSQDGNDCGSGSFDVELWSSGSGTDDDPQVLDQKLDTLLTGPVEGRGDLNVDIDGPNFMTWGIENNCGGGINDWNMVIYWKWRHDNP